MIKCLFSRRYIFFTLLIAVLCITFLCLAWWQWKRHHIQLAEDAIYLQQLEQAPVSINRWHDDKQLLNMTDRAVTVTGRFDYERQRILKNQTNSLGQGIHLITPFLIDGTTQAVLIDRGWVELHADSNLFDEEMSMVTGRIRQSDHALGIVPETALFRISIADLQPQFPYELLPIIITQSPLEDHTVHSRPLRTAVSLAGNYIGTSLGYMIQWIAFALIFGVGYGFYIHRQQ